MRGQLSRAMVDEAVAASRSFPQAAPPSAAKVRAGSTTVCGQCAEDRAAAVVWADATQARLGRCTGYLVLARRNNQSQCRSRPGAQPPAALTHMRPRAAGRQEGRKMSRGDVRFDSARPTDVVTLSEGDFSLCVPITLGVKLQNGRSRKTLTREGTSISGNYEEVSFGERERCRRDAGETPARRRRCLAFSPGWSFSAPSSLPTASQSSRRGSRTNVGRSCVACARKDCCARRSASWRCCTYAGHKPATAVAVALLSGRATLLMCRANA
jgi:hypothetical protein